MLSIVIITKDTRELLQQLLRSVEKDESLKAFLRETTVIDNASADGTGDMVRNEFPWTIYIRNDRNRGFAASANQGIGRSTGKYALLLNSDTILIEGEIAKMLAFMEDNVDVGICGPQLVYPDMRPQRSSASIPSLSTELLPFLAPRLLHPASSIQHPATRIDVPSLIGAAMMIRRSLFEALSGFDERFFFFLEETDLCLRAQQPSGARNEDRGARTEERGTRIEERGARGEGRGTTGEHRVSSDQYPVSSIEPLPLTPHASRLTAYRVVLLPGARIVHLQGKTVGKNWIKGRIEYNISLYKFIKKHHSPLYYRTFQAARFLKSSTMIIVLSLLFFLLIGKSIRKRYIYYWKIFLWHLAACPPTAGLQTPAQRKVREA